MRKHLAAAARRRIPTVVAADRYFDKVVSLLHFDGNLSDVKGITWTAAGQAAATGTAKYGTNALILDGAGDYLECASSALAGILEVKTPFTAEAWVLMDADAGTANMIFNLCGNNASGAGAIMLMVNGSNQLVLYASTVHTSWDMISAATSTLTLTDNVFSHVALTYDGVDDFRVWLDGALAISANSLGKLYYNTVNTANRIGAQSYPGNPNPFKGRIDDFRVTSFERYQANFTPPTAAFSNTQDPLYDAFYSQVSSLLHFDGNLTDQKGLTWGLTGDASPTGAAKFGSNSLVLDGTGDYASCIISNDMNPMLNGSYRTVEMWIKPDALTTYGWAGGGVQVSPLLTVGESGFGIFFTFGPLADGTLRALWYAGGLRAADSAPGAITTGVWQHIAFVHAAGVVRMYVNGIRVYSGAADPATAMSATKTLYLGVGEHATVRYDGLIDEFRFTGLARYNADFTPPVAAFPNT